MVICMVEEKQLVTTKMLLKDDAVDGFFEENSDFSESTKKNYLKALKKYSEYLGMMPSEFIAEAKQEQKTIPDINDRSINEKLARFPAKLKHLAPKTIKNTVVCINVFYKDKNIILPQRRKKKIHVATLKENFYIPTQEDMLTAIKIASLRNKTIIMMQATSCLGISEIVNLKMKNLEIDDEGITQISCSRQKTGYTFRTYSTPETTNMLKLYLEERNKSEKFKVLGENDWVFVSEELKKNRQLTVPNMMKMYRKLGEKMDMLGGRNVYSKFRSHNCRKYGNQCLRDAGAPLDFVDYISGRKESETHAAYHTWSDKRVKELYRSFMGSLSFEVHVQVVTNKELYAALNDVKLNYEMMRQEFEAMKDREEEVNRKANAIIVYEKAKEAGAESAKKMAVDKMK